MSFNSFVLKMRNEGDDPSLGTTVLHHRLRDTKG